MQSVVESYNQVLPTLIQNLTERLIADRIEPYASLPRDQVSQRMVASMQAISQDLRGGTTQYLANYFREVAPARAQQGTPVTAMLQVLLLSQEMADDLLLSTLEGDSAAQIWWVQRSRAIYTSAVLELSHVYAEAHQQVIRAQLAQIRELSTPLIPLHDGLLLLPLVGAFDSQRAQQVTEELLEAISREQAEVVIIDITGVPMVDTQVGHYLLQAARAAQLLGAQVVLVGISPEIAQTIVQIGITLSEITIKANLQAGLEYAFRLRGMTIKPRAA